MDRKTFRKCDNFTPWKEERTNPGSELVAFSHVTTISALTICDTHGQIKIEIIKNIATNRNYNKRNLFDKLLMNKDTISCEIVKDNTTKLHIVEKN